MNYHTIIDQIRRLRIITFVYCILIFFPFSCTDEVVVVPPDTTPTEVVLLSPESNTSNNLMFSAEVRYLNNSDIIQSHGFLVEGGVGENYIKKEYPISTALKAGRFTFKVPDPEDYKEGAYYTYKYFIQTDKRLYSSKPDQFVVNNLKVIAKENLIVAVGEMITVDGEFTDIEKNYDLYHSYYTHQEFKVPFEIINSGKSIRFTIPEGVQQGSNVTFRLVNKDKYSTHLAAIVAQAFIVATLSPPQSYAYYCDDMVNLPYPARGYDDIGIKVFIGNVFLKHSNYLRIYDFIIHQKGNTFPIGYTNGRDTVTFPEHLRLIEPDPNEFNVIPEHVHPGTKFEVSGPDPAKFDFYGYVTVGGKTAYYVKEPNASKGVLTIGDLPEGEYPMEMRNNYFTYKSNNKINVKNVNISSSNEDACYTGDRITLKGTFIKGQYYNLHIDNYSAYSICNIADEIIFEIPLMKAGNYQVKVSYGSDGGPRRSYYSNAIPLEIKATEINSVYPLRATAGSMITIEGHGMKGYRARIADVVMEHTVSENDKIQFEIPTHLPKGKYRVNLTYVDYDMQNVLSIPDYLEIY